MSLLDCFFPLTESETKILSFHHPGLTQVALVALLLGYEGHRNICTCILSGPLKELKLDLEDREEAVALWCYATESRLH